MRKFLLAAAVFALVAAMCIPISVFADDSDAWDVEEKEGGVSWESDTLTKDEYLKLYPADTLDFVASGVLDVLFDDGGVFDITEVVLSEAEISMSTGESVTSDKAVMVNSNSETYRLTFKANCPVSGEDLFKNSQYLKDLIRYLSPDNETRSDGVFEFDVECKEVTVGIFTQEYTKNSAGNYVVTYVEEKEKDYKSVTGDVKYTYKEAGETVEKEFSIDYVTDSAFTVSTEYDFGKPAEDVTAGEMAFVDSDISDVTYKVRMQQSFGGHTHGLSEDASDLMEVEMDFGAKAMESANILYDGDLSVSDYAFLYAAGKVALFYGVEDPALNTEEALKAFLDEHGSTGQTFGDAEDLADSEFKSPSKKSRVGLYIGIGAAVLVVAGVGAFLFIRAKS